MALPGEPNSKEDSGTKDETASASANTTTPTSIDNDDKDFNPSIEALIDEADDERTLEEEEALNENNGSTVQNELDDLKKESEMPIEELLAYYQRMRNEAGGPDGLEEDDEEEDDDEDDYDDEDDDDDDDDDEDSLNTPPQNQTVHIIPAVWRRFIHIGPEHQADVPEGLSEYEGDLPPYEPEDKLVWRCNPDLTQEQIIDYLKRATALSKKNDVSVSPASVPKISNDCARLYREKILDAASQNHEIAGTDNPPENFQDLFMAQSRKRARIDYELEQENSVDGINQSCGDNQPGYVAHSTREEDSNSLSTEEYFQDEEQLLYLLLQCNYNFDEALRRCCHEPMTLWSQEECLGFEHGLRIYGKDFRSIRENFVQTRTHPEVVAFYYLWKKSERYDIYTNQYRQSQA